MGIAKKHILSAVMVMTVVVFNLLGTTLFVHGHDIEGVTISHSHPYMGDPVDHSHSEGTLLLIELIANADAIATESVILDAITLEVYADTRSAVIERVDNYTPSFYTLRAPPVL